MNKAEELKVLFVSRCSMLLKELNISQSQLSKQIGVRQSTISTWLNLKDKNGKEITALPSAEALVSLAETLNTSTEYLLGLSSVSHEPQNEKIEQTNSMTIEELVKKRTEISNQIRILKDEIALQSGIVKLGRSPIRRGGVEIGLDKWCLYVKENGVESDDYLKCIMITAERGFAVSYIRQLIADLQNIYDELKGGTA